MPRRLLGRITPRLPVRRSTPAGRRSAAAALAALTIASAIAACGASEADIAASAAAASSAASVSSASSVSAASVASVASASSAASVSSVAAASAAAAASSSAASIAAAASASAAAAGPSTGTTTPGLPLAARESVADAAVAAAAAAVDQTAAVDPDTAGDDSGTPCAVDPRYTDETTQGLRTDIAAAWTAARALAAVDDVQMCLADGKRSRGQQQATFDDYVQKYGAEMAAQYVLPPEKSAHVLGRAIDVQPYAAYTWLEQTDGRLGFCRIYDNEAWHFEYDRSYTAGCPVRLPRPTA